MTPKGLRVVVLSAVILFCLGIWSCGLGYSHPPIVPIEVHSEALVHWLEHGIRGATLVHVDAHDDLGEIQADRFAAIESLAGRRDFKALRSADSLGVDGLYHEGNFVSAAVRLGIVRDIVWVIPGRIDDAARAVSNQAERGVATVPFEICTLETMPDFPGPVLLSVDLDFLPEFSESGHPGIEAPGDWSRSWGKAQRLHVVPVHSTGDGYANLPAVARDAVLDMLRAFLPAPSQWLSGSGAF
jgi:hypothetical protein